MKFINEARTIITKNFLSNPFLLKGLILGAFLVFFLIGDKPLYLDEAVSYLITQDFSKMFYVLWHFEGNMWLYYVLLHFWSYIGSSETILRSLSALFAIATLISAYFLARKLFDEKTANITLILLSVNVLFIKNAQYARGYSLLILLTTLSTFLFRKLLEKKTLPYASFYTLISVASVYTHLFGALVIASHFIYLLYLRDKKQLFFFSKIYVIVGLLILPLFIAPSMKSGQINWITLPGLFEVFATFFYLLGDFIAVAGVLSFLVLWYFISHKKYTLQDKNIVFLVILIAFPILTAFIVSYVGKPIYAFNYLSICLVPVLVLVAKAISVVNKKVLVQLLLFITVLSALRIGSWYQGGKITNTIPNQNADWEKASVYLETQTKPSDGIIFFPAYSQITYNYYDEKNAQKVTAEILPVQSINFLTLTPSKYNHDVLKNLPEKHSRIWLLQETDYAQNVEPMPQIKKVLTSYTMKQTTTFNKITIILFIKYNNTINEK